MSLRPDKKKITVNTKYGNIEFDPPASKDAYLLYSPSWGILRSFGVLDDRAVTLARSRDPIKLESGVEVKAADRVLLERVSMNDITYTWKVVDV